MVTKKQAYKNFDIGGGLDDKKLMQSNRNSISYQKKWEKCMKNIAAKGKDG